MILQFTVARVLADQSVLNDVDETRAEFADGDLAQFSGQRGSQRVDFTNDLIVFLIGVGKRFEFDDRESNAIGDDRLHLPPIVEFCQTIFQRLGDQSLQIFGVCTWHDGCDVETRNSKTGIFFTWNGIERIDAQHHETDKDHERELITADGEAENRHV